MDNRCYFFITVHKEKSGKVLKVEEGKIPRPPFENSPRMCVAFSVLLQLHAVCVDILFISTVAMVIKQTVLPIVSSHPADHAMGPVAGHTHKDILYICG